MLKEYIENKISINNKEFQLLVSKFSTLELDVFFNKIENDDFKENKSNIMNEQFYRVLYIEKYVKETTNKKIIINLFNNSYRESDVKSSILLDSPMKNLQIKSFTKIELIFLLNTIQFSTWNNQTSKISKLIKHFDLKKLMLLNVSNIKDHTVLNALFEISNKKELIECFKQNIGLKLSIKTLPNKLLKNKDFLISCFNELSIKEFNDTYNTEFLEKHTNTLTRNEVLNLEWFDISKDINKEVIFSNSNKIIRFFPQVLTNSEWYAYLSNKGLFNDTLFLSTYISIPKNIIKQFMSLFNDDSEIKSHFGNIRSRNRKSAFNYFTSISNDGDITPIDMERIVSPINLTSDLQEIISEYNNKLRYSIKNDIKSLRYGINNSSIRNSNSIIAIKEVIKSFRKDLKENNLPKTLILSLLSNEERKNYPLLNLKEDSILAQHYGDQSLSECDLEEINSLYSIENSDILELIARVENATDANELLNSLDIKGKFLRKTILSKMLSKQLNIFVIVKYLILKNFMLKYDVIVNELNKTDFNKDTSIFRLIATHSKLSFNKFEYLFKNKLFFKKTFVQFYKMLQKEKRSINVNTLLDTINLLKEHPSLNEQINVKEKRSIDYFHDKFNTLLLKDKSINYKFNKKHLINIRKFNKLNKERLNKYKIVLVSTNNELLNHSIKLGHCVGTASYNKGIINERYLIFGIKENGKLKYTAQYYLKENKLGQVEGKSYSTISDEDKTLLQKIISQ